VVSGTHAMRRGSRMVVLLPALFGVGLSALVLQARVYQTSGAMGGDLFNPSSLGKQVYRTAMTINGGRADVSVVDCAGGEASIRTVCGDMPAGSARYVAGESLGLGKAVRDGQVVRLVTLSPGLGSRTLLVTVAQSDSAVRASAVPPLRHQLEDVPVPPDATVLSYMKNDDTRTAMERLSVRMSGEGARRYFEGAMTRAGWARVAGTAGESGVAFYMKGADVCCVRVVVADSDGESRVTLLHKRGAVE